MGVSGGADSMALLHLLYSLRHELALDLIVVHYDHALRSGSRADLLFVKEISATLGLLFLSERNKIKLPKGISVEDFARQQRFDFFVRMAQKTEADGVVLAHTQDDLAETVLMRIFRGAGLSGLRSILPKRKIQGVTFFRPLLDVSRTQIELFLTEIKGLHVEDPTNAGDDFLRNRIRHKLIPYISKEFCSAIKEKLAELALNTSTDYDFIETSLQKILTRVLKFRNGEVKIMIKPWKACPQSIRRMVLREAAAKIIRSRGSLSFQHALFIEKTALQRKTSRISLPSGLEAVITDKFITLS